MGSRQKSRHKKSRTQVRLLKIRSHYIGGSVLVLSGGVVVLVVSAVVCEVSIVLVDVVLVIVESVLVLSEEPDRFLVELHADVANIIEPATARLKIIFFM
jgi:hypothetical protein